MKTEESNYEKVFRQFQEWFLKSDHQKTAKKLELKIDEKMIYVPFFHEPYLLDRHTGEIRKEDGTEASVTDRLTIMHHLHYYKEYAEESSRLVAFREIKEAAIFERAYQKSALEPLVRYFGKKKQELLMAGLRLGGAQEKYGDVSVCLQAFPKIKLVYILWEADEEFPASANILFDDKIAQWTHGESVPVLAQLGTERLIAAAI